MARWKLVTAHYLNLKNSAKWEYTELDRVTGQPIRQEFKVPTLLDPNDKIFWNYLEGRDYGEIHVSDGNGAQPRDYIFTGAPTPDMIPLDDDAKAICAKYDKQWSKINSAGSDPEKGYGDALIRSFQEQIAEVQSVVMAKPAEIAGMSDLLAALGTMMQQNQTILAALAQKAAPEAPAVARRA